MSRIKIKRPTGKRLKSMGVDNKMHLECNKENKKGIYI